MSLLGESGYLVDRIEGGKQCFGGKKDFRKVVKCRKQGYGFQNTRLESYCLSVYFLN